MNELTLDTANVDTGLVRKTRYIVGLLHSDHQVVLVNALEWFFTHNLRDIWSKAADAGIQYDNVDVTVMSLDRIGAPQGESGAKVVLVVYRSTTDGEEYFSPPLVLKIGERRKLDAEFKSKTDFPTVDARFKLRFAIPIALYPDNGTNESLAVLAAPFLSEEGTPKEEFRHKDLWRHLDCEDEFNPAKIARRMGKIEGYINQTTGLMNYIHMDCKGSPVSLNDKRSDSVLYKDAYKWYLWNSGTFQAATYPALFGTESTVDMLGKKWQNPYVAIDKVLSMVHCPAMGFVHGDLHPKNIVIDHAKMVNVIDFGWYYDNAPIVVDYILLDINMRAMTLPTRFLYEDVMKIAAYLHPDHPIASDVADPIQKRMGIILRSLWEPLLDRGAFSKTEWYNEYLIPFFIVAYRHLAFLRSAKNQIALLATVLSACKLLYDTEIIQ